MAEPGASEDLRLDLENRPENVAVVRQALAGLAEAIALDPGQLEEVKTAVSEACNNVVLHAYAGERGPLQVVALHSESALEVRVGDRGQGMERSDPQPDVALPGMGIELMRALADRVEFVTRPEGGTVVTIGFDSRSPLTCTDGAVVLDAEEAAETEPRVLVELGRVAAPVIGRVTGMLAARAGLSIERLADTQLITDALAAHAPPWVAGDALDFTVIPDGTGVVLSLGSLRPGGASEILRESAVAGLPPLLERLADTVDVDEGGAGERLRLLVAQRG